MGTRDGKVVGQRLPARCLFLLLWALVSVCAAQEPTVDDEERVVVFDSMARVEKGRWILPVRGRVYRPQTTVVRKNLFAAILEGKYGLQETPATAQNFDERIKWFVVKGKSEERLIVHVGEHKFEVGPSGSNGYFDDFVSVLQQPSTAATRFVLGIALEKDEHRLFEGEVVAPPENAVMVVSDIDDTIKVSHVKDTGKLLDNTFYRDYEAVPGMVSIYRRWSDQGAVFHYVSSSPWQLYVPLRDFMWAAGYPRGAIYLKRANVTDGTFLTLFKGGAETKPDRIQALLDRFAGHHFILVGDSGEQDPEAYASLMHRHPKQISHIYIRNVTGESRGDTRFQETFAGIDDSRWDLFDDPASLSGALEFP